MKRLQQIWNFWINHSWFLPIVVLCLFGALSLLQKYYRVDGYER